MAAFLEFCYLAQRAYLTDSTLRQMNHARQRFHQYRTVFQTSGVRPDGFSLPRQHSLDHYLQHIRNFGAPNGLCTSITEAKHIKAVKEPWRRSNHYEALGQMLLTNQRNEKLAAARADFAARGMLSGTCLSAALAALQPPDDDGEHAHSPENASSGAGDDHDYEDDPYEDPSDDEDDDDPDGNDRHDGQHSNHDHHGDPVSQNLQQLEAGGVEAECGDLEESVGQGGEELGDGVVSGPRVSGFVVLARKPRESPFIFLHAFPIHIHHPVQSRTILAG